MTIDAEVSENAKQFRDNLPGKIQANLEVILARDHVKIDEAYARLTTLEAWKSFVLNGKLASGPMGFFIEAQNDGLTSSALVSTGLWRSSMKSLRGLIENIIQALYFMDHPVEYRKWETGDLRPTFRDLFDYLSDHPDIKNLPAALNSVAALHSHYRHLSNILHASSKEFRMTDEIGASTLWKINSAELGKWSSTQKNVLRDINLLLLALFSKHIQGASNLGLRQSISLCLPAAKDAKIKSELGVKIVR